MRRALILTNLLFGLALFLPLIQSSVRVFPRLPLHGAELPPERPVWSWRGWFDGTYAERYEKSHAARLSLRTHLVRTDNQISYSLFGQVAKRTGTTVVLGRDGWLYEGTYIDRHNQPPDISEEQLNRRVGEARRLQELLLKRGIGFMVVLAPSKVTIYPEFLREGALTRARDAPGAYERTIPALEAADVRTLDARKLFLKWKPDSEFPLFPHTGTHWSYAAVARVTDELLRGLGEQTGKAFPEIVLTGLRRGGDPNREENDLGALLNLWSWRRLAKTRIEAVIEVRQPANRPPPRLLFVGDSFAHTINRFLDRHHVVARQDLLYYFNRRFSYPGKNEEPIDRKSFPLRDEILACDAVVLVFNEYWLPDIGFGFLELAIGALETP